MSRNRHDMVRRVCKTCYQYFYTFDRSVQHCTKHHKERLLAQARARQQLDRATSAIDPSEVPF